MSLILPRARAQYSGDPGLFGFLGSAVKGIAGVVGGAAKGFLSGGPLGAIQGGLGSLVKIPQATAVAREVRPSLSVASIQGGGQAMPGTGVQVQLPQVGPLGGGGFQIGTFGPAAPGQFGGVTSGSSSTAMAGACLSGHHINKSTYLTQRGVVQAGTVCVKNRHMNPLNPRAASRAMRRLDGFSRATRSVEKMMVKIARKNAPRGRSSAPRKSCSKCR